jgi:hypothetical protein
MPVNELALRAAIQRTGNAALQRSANAGASALRKNLELGQRSGIQHEFLPNRSSAPGEFPQYQSGDLYNSVSAHQLGNLRFNLGYANTPGYAVELEYRPETRGGRPALFMTFYSKEVQNQMTQAARPP